MRWSGRSFTSLLFVVAMMCVTVVAVRAVRDQAGAAPAGTKQAAAPAAASSDAAIIARGRVLVINHACGLCHGGNDDPGAKGWLAGSTGPDTEFKIGPPPCGVDPKAPNCFTTRPRNLTPDNLTGMGRFTERQLFNALRY